MTIQNYYAARASEYDKVYAKPERQTDLRDIERWLPPIFAGRSVLEVACGTGYWTQFVAPLASTVLALDSSPETLRIARERVSSGNARFIVGDAYALPQLPSPLDSALAAFWISHVPKARLRPFVLGLHGVLKPGAVVVFLDNRFVEGSSSRLVDRDTEGNTFQTRALVDGRTFRVLKNFPTEDALRSSFGDLAAEFEYRSWQYFWAAKYVARVP